MEAACSQKVKEPPDDVREVRVTLIDGRKGIGFHYPLGLFWEVWAEDLSWWYTALPEHVVDWEEINDHPIEAE